MLYRCRTPGPPLDAFVEWVWVVQDDRRPPALERVLPTGTAQLIVNRKEDETRVYDPDRQFQCITNSGTVVGGVRTRYEVIDTAEQEDVAGVVFKPAGMRAFMHVASYETTDCDVSLDLLWGGYATALLRERLLEAGGPDAALDALEAALLERYTGWHPHPAVAAALATFDRAPEARSVDTVVDAVGLSAKRFIEHFKADVGVTPKRYCRIRRFQRALAQVHRGRPVDWVLVALDGGYYDQSHFINEFRSFTGLTPTDYEARRTAFPNHVKFFQDDASGGLTRSGHDQRNDQLPHSHAIPPRQRCER